MRKEMYTEVTNSDDFTVFDFISRGYYGDILKRVAFLPTDQPHVFNLVLGDVNEEDEIDNFSISNNGDRNKVLATVASIIKSYTTKFPHHTIVFYGSTDGRTRLYRMALSIYFKELSQSYDIFCINEKGKMVPFTPNQPSILFVIKRKNI